MRDRRLPTERPLAVQVAALFANGEQGLWYDPSDMSTMYQDAVGSIPVYAPGQGQADPPVGLILDKRRLARLAERLTASWATDTGITESGGNLTFSAAPSSSYATNAGTVVAGRWYELKLTLSGFSGSGGVSWVFAGASVGNVYNANGTYSQIILAQYSGVLAVRARLATTNAVVSGISARELTGNHAYQTTTASRPTLSARYNLLLSTESLADSPWTINGTCTRTGAFSTAPNGTLTATRIQLGTLATDEVRQTFSTTAGSGVSYNAAIWLKSNTGADQQVRLKNTHINVIDNFQSVTVTADWQRFILSVTNGASAGTGQLLGITNSAGGGAKDILAWGADLRLVNDGVGLPPYQRVVDANTYDSAGFPTYMKFDGVDDGLQTVSVDFSGSDKVFCCASFRKLSDAATGSLFELSATIASNPGSFYITAPGAGNSGNIKLATKGTAEVNVATTAAGYPSPISAIASAIMDIAAPISTLRVNGALAQSSSVSLGSGSLGNYPLFIGRRGGASLPFNGRLYGLLIRSGAANDAQVAKVERLLNQKAKVA